jgi:atypical dual specificity phosphatase
MSGKVDLYGNRIDETIGRPFDCVDISRITSRLYLGSFEAGAKMAEGLKFHGITHVLTVGCRMPIPHAESFEYKVIEFEDHHDVDIKQHFDTTYQFLRSALESSQTSRALVHCWAGVSRSATIVMAFLMRHYTMSYQEAFEHVRRARHWVCPNRGFRAQLRFVCNQNGTYDIEKIKVYDRASKYLRRMHKEKTIDQRHYAFVNDAFAYAFGELHPNTLDVQTEMQPFREKKWI